MLPKHPAHQKRSSLGLSIVAEAQSNAHTPCAAGFANKKLSGLSRVCNFSSFQVGSSSDKYATSKLDFSNPNYG